MRIKYKFTTKPSKWKTQGILGFKLWLFRLPKYKPFPSVFVPRPNSYPPNSNMWNSESYLCQDTKKCGSTSLTRSELTYRWVVLFSNRMLDHTVTMESGYKSHSYHVTYSLLKRHNGLSTKAHFVNIKKVHFLPLDLNVHMRIQDHKHHNRLWHITRITLTPRTPNLDSHCIHCCLTKCVSSRRAPHGHSCLAATNRVWEETDPNMSEWKCCLQTERELRLKSVFLPDRDYQCPYTC